MLTMMKHRISTRWSHWTYLLHYEWQPETNERKNKPRGIARGNWLRPLFSTLLHCFTKDSRQPRLKSDVLTYFLSRMYGHRLRIRFSRTYKYKLNSYKWHYWPPETINISHILFTWKPFGTMNAEMNGNSMETWKVLQWFLNILHSTSV